MENSINQLPKPVFSPHSLSLESYYRTDFNQPGLIETVRFLVTDKEEKLASLSSIAEQTLHQWINSYNLQIVKFTNNTLASASLKNCHEA